MTILVTGASGFIGRNIIAELLRRSLKVRAVRRLGGASVSYDDGVELASLSGSGAEHRDWSDAVAGCSVVIHLAAFAHVFGDAQENRINSFQFANVELARACCEASARAGVRRFIFLSSAGVHGGARGTIPIQVDDALSPHTPYAQSKADAERALNKVLQDFEMTSTIIRPPLVYGPRAPGNFGKLVNAISRGLPLPLGLVTRNRRSFIAIDNLVDLILSCIDHPLAANQTFLASDGEDLSTAELLLRIGAVMGRPARLVPVPMGLLGLGARLLGKQEMFQSLCGSLQLDITKTRQILDWSPPISVELGLHRAVCDVRC